MLEERIVATTEGLPLGPLEDLAVAEGEPRIMVHQEEVVDTLGEVVAHTQTKQAGEGALTVMARIVQE